MCLIVEYRNQKIYNYLALQKGVMMDERQTVINAIIDKLKDIETQRLRGILLFIMSVEAYQNRHKTE